MREQQTRARRRARRGTILTVSLLATFAFVAAALAGTAVANPTALCKVEIESPGGWCSEGDTYTAGTELEATSENIKIESDAAGLTYSCDKATARFTTTNSAGEPLPTDLTEFSLSGCKISGVSKTCTVSTSNLGELNITDLYGEDRALGDITSVSWTWTCKVGKLPGEFELGTWNGAGLEPAMKGGSPASFNWEKQPLTCAGDPCEGYGKLTANFVIKTPQPLHFGYGAKGL